MKDMTTWSLCVASNDSTLLHENLLASPDIAEAAAVIVQNGFSSAAHAYNDALERVTTDIVVFAHQDVYLPAGWADGFGQAIERLEKVDPNWAVAGSYGTSYKDRDAGLVYCVANRRMMGRVTGEPQSVDSLDELLLVIKRSSGLRFDEGLRGFHFYGTDICLQAKDRGLSCYAFEELCIHNAEKTEVLPWAFWKGYFYIRKKWRRYLPIATPCICVTANPLDVVTQLLRGFKNYFVPLTNSPARVTEPNLLAASLQSHIPSK